MREMKDSGIECYGEIPAHWEIKPLRFIFSFTKGLSITKADLVEDGIPVISYGQIHAKDCDGVHLMQPHIRYISNDFPVISSSRMEKEDIVFADTSEDLEGMGNAVRNDNDLDVYAGYHTVLGHSILHEDNRYFGYLFKSVAWRYQLQRVAECVKVYSITQRRLKASKSIVPPLEERIKISDFLDSKCSQIDAAISRQESLIEKLEEYRRSVITEAVTKGLDPDAEMKDSGIDWIGKIPEKWNVEPLKHLVSLRSGDPISKEKLSSGGEFPVFGAGKKIGNYNQYNVEPNTVIIGRVGTCGEVYYLKEAAFVTDNALIVKTRLSSRFVYYVLSASDIKSLKTISAQPLITAGNIYKYKIPVPDDSTQRLLTLYLDTKCSQIDAAIRRQESIIEKLKAYRQSLIYEVVTGKKEVV